MNFFWKNKKWIIGIVIIAGFVGIEIYRNMALIKYETRRLNIKFFQGGEVAGGTMTLVPAKYHRQEHALSCEIAALKIALSVYGLDIPESELISKLKFDPTRRAKGVWGNPYTGFVGNIDGKMGVDGYGVYWDPIADVANQYLKAEVVEITPQSLAQHLENGHPVVSWGYFGRGKRIVWNTPDGQTINAVNGEHARTIVGFTGTVDNPTGFVIFDPIYGELYWKTKDLMNNWAPFNNKGVVVYQEII